MSNFQEVSKSGEDLGKNVNHIKPEQLHEYIMRGASPEHAPSLASDNLPGIPKEKLDEIQQLMKAHDPKQIGDNNPNATKPSTLPDFQLSSDYVDKEWKRGAADAPPKHEVEDAKKILAGTIDAKFTGKDKATISDAQDALLKGDPEALSSALGSLKDDPTKLKGVVEELNRELQLKHAGVNLTLNDGSINVSAGSETGGMYDVNLDLKTGKSSGMFQTLGRTAFDGASEENSEQVLKRIGNGAVKGIFVDTLWK